MRKRFREEQFPEDHGGGFNFKDMLICRIFARL
jgi:hypothetical protein